MSPIEKGRPHYHCLDLLVVSVSSRQSSRLTHLRGVVLSLYWKLCCLIQNHDMRLSSFSPYSFLSAPPEWSQKRPRHSLQGLAPTEELSGFFPAASVIPATRQTKPLGHLDQLAWRHTPLDIIVADVAESRQFHSASPAPP